MKTREVLELLAQLVPGDTILVSSLGRTSEEAFRLFPNRTLFLDSMGDIASVASGLALGLGPEYPVVALDTDGSHLMGLSILPTLAALADSLPNLLLLVLDNGLYESAGRLPSRDCSINWVLLGQAFGVDVQIASHLEHLACIIHDAGFSRFTYVAAMVENPDLPESVQKNVDGIESKYRFIRYLEIRLAKTLVKPSVKS